MYRLFLSTVDNKDILEFPVLTDELTLNFGTAIKRYDVVNMGEIVLPDDRKLVDISFSGFFPLNSAPYVSSLNLLKPREYIDKMNYWKNTGVVLKLVLTGAENPLNISCLIGSFTIKEKGGEVGDIYFNLTLTEYREMILKKLDQKIIDGIKKILVPKQTNKKTTRAVTKKVPGKVVTDLEKQKRAQTGLEFFRSQDPNMIPKLYNGALGKNGIYGSRRAGRDKMADAGVVYIPGGENTTKAEAVNKRRGGR